MRPKTRTVIDLTGKDVDFVMYDSAGDIKVAQTAAVTVGAPTDGKVEYDFQAADVDTIGTFYGYFIVKQASETERVPVDKNGLVIEIQGAT